MMFSNSRRDVMTPSSEAEPVFPFPALVAFIDLEQSLPMDPSLL